MDIFEHKRKAQLAGKPAYNRAFLGRNREWGTMANT